MTGSFVFVDDFFVGYAIDNAGCFSKHFVCSSLVAGSNCLTYAFN